MSIEVVLKLKLRSLTTFPQCRNSREETINRKLMLPTVKWGDLIDNLVLDFNS